MSRSHPKWHFPESNGANAGSPRVKDASRMCVCMGSMGSMSSMSSAQPKGISDTRSAERKPSRHPMPVNPPPFSHASGNMV